MRDEYVNADGLGTETMLQNNRIDQFRYLYNQPKKIQAAYDIVVLNREKQLKCLKIGVYSLVNNFVLV